MVRFLTQMMKSNAVRAAWCWDRILYVIMTICVFGALVSFFMLHDTKAAIEALILGFLLSPYGIPMIGAVIIAFLQGINEAIKSI